MRISDWSSDVCSSDLAGPPERQAVPWALRHRLRRAHTLMTGRSAPLRVGSPALEACRNALARIVRVGDGCVGLGDSERGGYLAARSSRGSRAWSGASVRKVIVDPSVRIRLQFRSVHL